jgi:hypothetical protein
MEVTIVAAASKDTTRPHISANNNILRSLMSQVRSNECKVKNPLYGFIDDHFQY